MRAILALGHSLEIPVSAAGVETPAQAEFLAGEGCEEVHGFLYGYPQHLA